MSLRLSYPTWALALSLVTLSTQGENYVGSVLDYTPGTGFAVEFGSGLGFTNTQAVLGEPSRMTPGPFGGAVDPFSPPFTRDQLLSIGTGGSLTVALDQPVFDDPSHPHGIDFMFFGNSGFMITNGNFTGGGITDGTLFGQSTGDSQVYVSSDNESYFAVDMTLAPSPDGYYPTDGQGLFHLPVDPALTADDFAGTDLEGIRSLYAGSGGGAGFDIQWARDANNQPANLSSIQYIRIDVLSDKVEIDAVSAVPEPAPLVLIGLAGVLFLCFGRFKRSRSIALLLPLGLCLSLPSRGATLKEDFSSDPMKNGWRSLGNPDLFRWKPEAETLEATWDTEQPNSLFYWPFDTPLTAQDDFSFAFDLRLHRQEITLEGPYAFEIALGLLDADLASQPAFHRGTGTDSPNLVEFDYFPDTGFGATVSPAIVSTENQFATTFNYPVALTLDDWFHIRMSFNASSRTLETVLTRKEEPLHPIKDVVLPDPFTGFKVNAFSVTSYADNNENGSLLLQGTVDNVAITLPPPPIDRIQGRFVEDHWAASFQARSGWDYSLERSVDFATWVTLQTVSTDGHSELSLLDPAPPDHHAFYRVRAERQ